MDRPEPDVAAGIQLHLLTGIFSGPHQESKAWNNVTLVVTPSAPYGGWFGKWFRKKDVTLTIKLSPEHAADSLNGSYLMCTAGWSTFLGRLQQLEDPEAGTVYRVKFLGIAAKAGVHFELIKGE